MGEQESCNESAALIRPYLPQRNLMDDPGSFSAVAGAVGALGCSAGYRAPFVRRVCFWRRMFAQYGGANSHRLPQCSRAINAADKFARPTMSRLANKVAIV